MDPSAPTSLRSSAPSFAELFTPKLITILREGYGWQNLRADAVTSMPNSSGNNRSCHVVVSSTTVFVVYSRQGEAGDQDSDFAFAVFGDLP